MAIYNNTQLDIIWSEAMAMELPFYHPEIKVYRVIISNQLECIWFLN